MAYLAVKPYRVEVTEHSLKSVSTDRAKEQLMIYDDDSNAVIDRYIETATSLLEEWAGYFLMPAKITAYFNYCSSCCLDYVLQSRPFNSLVRISVLQDGSYVDLTSEQYSVMKGNWETVIRLCDSVEVDTECGDVDQVKIEYLLGQLYTTEIHKAWFTDVAGEKTATIETSIPHGMITGDIAVISDVGVPDMEGAYSITKISSIKFSYTFISDILPSDISNELVFYGVPLYFNGVPIEQGGTVPEIIGMVTTPQIPPQLEQSVLEMTAGMYSNRGDCSDACGIVPCSAQAKASQFKRQIVRTSRGYKDACCC